MPLDPNIFYNFAALRAQDNARLGQTMNNAIQGYQDRKMKEAELRAKGPDYKRLAFDEFYNVAQGGQPTPQGIAAIKALSAFEGQKVTYQPDAEGNVRAVTQPSLWDTFSQMQGIQSYTPQYPIQQDTTMAGVTFPAPGVVSREPLGPLPGIEGIPPINESDLMAQSQRMPINMPQSLTPQQAAALQERGDMFSGEAPPLPGDGIQVPVVPGAGDKTNQALREEAGKAQIGLQKLSGEADIKASQAGAEKTAQLNAENTVNTELRNKGLSDLVGNIDRLIQAAQGTPSGTLAGLAATATEIVGVPSKSAIARAEFASGKAITGLQSRIAFLKGQGTITDAEAKQAMAFIPDSNDPYEIKITKLNAAKEYLSGLTGSVNKINTNKPGFRYLGTE